jgi:Lrp/AsnC family transcriptional regulator, leucine-responsive regulatory protein
LDNADSNLLELLQRDCTLSYADLAKHVGLSVTPVVERLKKLRARGHIRAHVALINPQSLGLNVCAFVSVMVERPSVEASFVERMSNFPAVQECHVTSGEYSIFLKLRVTDSAALEAFLAGQIKSFPGVLRTRVEIALATHKETLSVPLGNNPM